MATDDVKRDEGEGAPMIGTDPAAPPHDLRASVLRMAGREVMVLSYSMETILGVWERLSPAEREVAELLLTGATNAEIARRRGTSSRTVANQTASIFRKVKVGSRMELAHRLLHPYVHKQDPEPQP